MYREGEKTIQKKGDLEASFRMLQVEPPLAMGQG
jgi:hypothetical protein